MESNPRFLLSRIPEKCVFNLSEFTPAYSTGWSEMTPISYPDRFILLFTARLLKIQLIPVDSETSEICLLENTTFEDDDNWDRRCQKADRIGAIVRGSHNLIKQVESTQEDSLTPWGWLRTTNHRRRFAQGFISSGKKESRSYQPQLVKSRPNPSGWFSE